MATTETTKVGKRGTIVIPARLRRRFGIAEGDLVITEERKDGVLLRPALPYYLDIDLILSLRHRKNFPPRGMPYLGSSVKRFMAYTILSGTIHS